MTAITNSELKARIISTPQKISFGLLEVDYADNPYEKFIELVEMALDFIAQKLSRNPELQQKSSEDLISTQICNLLVMLGFDAWHDAKEGGHCDIVIESLKDMIWLGEAKKLDSTNNPWAEKGFEQLSNRYSTGNPKQDHGGVLLYCFMENIKSTMEKWDTYLNSNVTGIVTKPCERNPMCIKSVHTHTRTGSAYYIRHQPISFYFAPTDAKKSKSKKVLKPIKAKK